MTGALALAFLLVGGCSNEESQEAASAEPSAGVESQKPEEYMKDPDFRAKLANERHHRERLVGKRAQLLRQLEKKSLAIQAKMPNATEAELVAELEKDPEWRSLASRVEDLMRAQDESRAQSLKIVRERIAVPLDPISK